MALVLSETAAGGAILLFLTPLWREVRRGFFKLTGSILLVVALAGWGAAASARVAGSGDGRAATWLAAAFAGITFLWVALLFARAQLAARAIGMASIPLSVAALTAMAGTADRSTIVALFLLLAGAAFLGAVTDGLLLGHWYLTDRGLTRTPIDRATLLLIVSVAFETFAVIAGGFGPAPTSSDFNPLLGYLGIGTWIALGMVGATGLTAVMIRLTLRGERASAVQSATGFFYLAVVFAFTAEVAAKVRFLP